MYALGIAQTNSSALSGRSIAEEVSQYFWDGDAIALEPLKDSDIAQSSAAVESPANSQSSQVKAIDRLASYREQHGLNARKRVFQQPFAVRDPDGTSRLFDAEVIGKLSDLQLEASMLPSSPSPPGT